MALAGFSVGEAEGLRRAMSRKRSQAALEAYRARFIAGACERGVDGTLADAIYDKLVAFSGFGFPKSHAAAFGLLAYQSAWLRHHHPAEFLCALLNAQPMGFYPPASLIRDAQRRGVEVRGPDVNASAAKATVEDGAVRVGLAYVKSVGDDHADALVAERERGGPFASVADLAHRLSVPADVLEALVASGACDCLGGPRHEAELPEQRPPRAAEALAGAAGDERLERPLGQLRALDEVGQVREGAVPVALRDERLRVLLPHFGHPRQPEPHRSILDRTFGQRPVDVGRQHLHPAPLRIADERRRRVEAHRLRVEERAQELGWVVVAEPGGLVREQPERGGV